MLERRNYGGACALEKTAQIRWAGWEADRLLGGSRTILAAAAVAASTARLRLLRDVVTTARRSALRRVALEEALLQCYLFAGYPRAIDALSLLQDLWPRRHRAPALSPSEWQARGELLCRRVYGSRYNRLRELMDSTHPDLSRWMIGEGYGKVLSRPGLASRSRELCTVAVLAALDAPRQLEAHVIGALNVGARPGEVEAALRIAGLGCGIRTWQRSLSVARRRLYSENGKPSR